MRFTGGFEVRLCGGFAMRMPGGSAGKNCGDCVMQPPGGNHTKSPLGGPTLPVIAETCASPPSSLRYALFGIPAMTHCFCSPLFHPQGSLLAGVDLPPGGSTWLMSLYQALL